MTKEENVDFIVNQVPRVGFSDAHEAQIREGASKGLPQFMVGIPHEYNGVKTDNTLVFNLSNQGFYFFNEYYSTITNRPKDEVASRPVKEKVNGKYPKNTITIDESINLRLVGSVHKEITYSKLNMNTGMEEDISFSTWKKADQTQINEYDQFPQAGFKYPGFDSDLRKFPIVGKENPEFMNEIRTKLMKGEAVLVDLKSGKTEMSRWLEVDAKAQKIASHINNPRLEVTRSLQQALNGQSEAAAAIASANQSNNSVDKAASNDQSIGKGVNATAAEKEQNDKSNNKKKGLKA